MHDCSDRGAELLLAMAALVHALAGLLGLYGVKLISGLAMGAYGAVRPPQPLE